MARQNLKREGRSWQDGRAPWQGLGTVHGHTNPMCRHENHGGRGRVVPCTFILPSLNCAIFNGLHANFVSRQLSPSAAFDAPRYRLARYDAKHCYASVTTWSEREFMTRGHAFFDLSRRQSGRFMEPDRLAVAIWLAQILPRIDHSRCLPKDA